MEIQSKYFAMVPVSCLNIEQEYGDWEQVGCTEQERLLQNTVCHPRSRERPPGLKYRRAFLKHVINKLERAMVEICDAVYDEYAKLMALPEDSETGLCFKTYTLPNSQLISLRESQQLISKGTTGLRTWQAAQYLAEWMMENHSLLAGKTILELGSGLGFTGLVACSLPLLSYTFSDCHSNVIEVLVENIQNNLPFPNVKNNHAELRRTETDSITESQPSDDGALVVTLSSQQGATCDTETERQVSPCDNGAAPWCVKRDDWKLDSCELISIWRYRRHPLVSIAELDWESVDPEQIGKCFGDVNVVLAADVVYDTSIIPSLVKVLDILVELPQQPTVYIASTIRNEATKEKFLAALAGHNLQCCEVEGPKAEVFHYDRTTPIEILRIGGAGHT